MRPMLFKWYFYSPIWLFAYLIGCYPNKPLLPFMQKYAGTRAAIRYARAGNTLGIYPEGRRVKHHHVKAKYGVIKILEGVESPEIYLVKLTRNVHERRFFTATIRKDNSVASLRDPEEIMDRIFRLDHNT